MNVIYIVSQYKQNFLCLLCLPMMTITSDITLLKPNTVGVVSLVFHWCL